MTDHDELANMPDANIADVLDERITPEDAQLFLSNMPDGIKQSRALLDTFISTIPDGTPPQVLSLLRRTFVAGAVSHMEQVRMAFSLPSLQTGNPEALLDAVAALGVGANILLQEEHAIIMSGRNTPANDGPKIVLASDSSHANGYGRVEVH